MKKERIDNLLVERQIAETLIKAHALIMSGIVLVEDKRVDKPSEKFSVESQIRLKGNLEKQKYVGRGGIKLEKALQEFHIHISKCVCLDIGASTGGFTDCLLQNGAAKVVAVDAGTNQLDWKIRNDARVEARENTNARYLKSTEFAEKFGLIVVDVSFISVTKILPALKDLLAEDGEIIVLIKPQFEVDRADVGEGGIVRDVVKHQAVINKVNESAKKNGLRLMNVIESPILGAEGNKEFFAHYKNA